MIQVKKLVSGLLTVSSAVALSGAGMAASAFAANALTVLSSEISNPAGQVTGSISKVSDHKIYFNAGAGTTIKAIKVEYRIAASGTSTAPLNLSTVGVTSPATVQNGSTGGVGGASTTFAATGAAGQVLLTDATGITPAGPGTQVTITLANITNNDSTASGAGVECDPIANSETCYMIISTYSDNVTQDSGTLIATGVVSYTVMTPITVTGIVDPSLTFEVQGVTAAALNGNDGNASCATVSNNVDTTATSVPFGNIRVGVAKCAQQALNVKTNAQFGFSVYHKFVGAAADTNMMQGSVPTNNIDPIPAAWSDNVAFTAPTGQANVGSGYLGVHVKNPAAQTKITSFSNANSYAGPAVNNTAVLGNKVMDKDSTDDGGVAYVTYKIQTDSNQPADTYTGHMVYNAVPKY